MGVQPSIETNCTQCWVGVSTQVQLCLADTRSVGNPACRAEELTAAAEMRPLFFLGREFQVSDGTKVCTGLQSRETEQGQVRNSHLIKDIMLCVLKCFVISPFPIPSTLGNPTNHPCEEHPYEPWPLNPHVVELKINTWNNKTIYWLAGDLSDFFFCWVIEPTG